MLNWTFSKAITKRVVIPYVLPADIGLETIHGNQQFDSGPELRIQEVYTLELWEKLERLGVDKKALKNSSVLELCAGTGFLTYHIFKKATSVSRYVVNDISEAEIVQHKNLMAENNFISHVDYIIGDFHDLELEGCFDLIIGNSFLHHFHNVPAALKKINKYLKPGGQFVALHEPTLASTVLESAKLLVYPFCVLFPSLVNNFARSRYRGKHSETDLWIFDKKGLTNLLVNSGFDNVTVKSWHLLRPILIEKKQLHLNSKKDHLSPNEERLLRKVVKLDGMINRILPNRFFGSLSVVATKRL